MSLRVLFLRKNRKAKFKKRKIRHPHIKWNDGLYVLDPEKIKPYEENGRIKTAQVIFFEGNPNPLSKEGLTDKSAEYLDEYYLHSAIKQTAGGPRFKLNLEAIIDMLGFLGDPVNWIYILFAGAIVTALLYG